MFLNKEFCADGIRVRVKAWITFFNKQQGTRTLSGICVGSETGFHLGNMRSRGPPKGVYQSLSSYVQQCVGEGVGQYTRHNPYHTDHMKINRPRTVD